MRVLFAEDEKDLNRIVSNRLKENGYSVDSCFDGQEALDFIECVEYDAIILDVMMPILDGFKVLDSIRKKGVTTPILFLTARDAINDKVKGLDLGANDYLVKPFAFDELLARLRAIMRVNFGHLSNIIKIDDLMMNIDTHTVERANKSIPLSSKEFALLEYMMHNVNIVLAREKIEDHIWNFEYDGGTNVVDVYVNYLRNKIDKGFDKKLIQTVRGVGYMLQGEIVYES